MAIDILLELLIGGATLDVATMELAGFSQQEIDYVLKLGDDEKCL